MYCFNLLIKIFKLIYYLPCIELDNWYFLIFILLNIDLDLIEWYKNIYKKIYGTFDIIWWFWLDWVINEYVKIHVHICHNCLFDFHVIWKECSLLVMSCRGDPCTFLLPFFSILNACVNLGKIQNLNSLGKIYENLPGKFWIRARKKDIKAMWFYNTTSFPVLARPKLNINMMHHYSIILFVIATVSSLELPTDLHDSSWNYKSDEGNGFIIFYNEKMVFNGVIWNLVSLTGNFMSFQR